MPSILVVDDIPENLDVIKNILSPDYTVKAAVNGEMALKIAANHDIDLILLDIMMPGMDGYEVCQHLKADRATADIPVIFVTARDDDTDEAKGFELGGVDYITKPISPTILKARTETHLALQAQNKMLEKRVNERTKELKQTRLAVIERLGRAAEYRDNETGLHVIRVGKYCKELALAFGLPEEQADLIKQASPMHDVGKIGIPDHILLKPGKLTEEEFEIIKTHSKIGSNILNGSDFKLMRMAQTIALYHHEKWNGKGYPNGVRGENIPLEARIVAICDVFDALTCTRPYKEPWPDEKAIDLIRSEAGKHFDPALVEAFEEIIPAFLEIKEQFRDD